MRHFVKSIEHSLTTKNWYGALALALTLPDIAGKIDYPHLKSQARYAAWFDKYVAHNYRKKYNFDPKKAAEESGIPVEWLREQILNGDECFALRCAFLHAGTTDIKEQKAQQIRNVIHRFSIIAPDPNGRVLHKNQIEWLYQIQLDLFCVDMINGINSWMSEKPSEREGMLNFLVVPNADSNIMLNSGGIYLT